MWKTFLWNLMIYMFLNFNSVKFNSVYHVNIITTWKKGTILPCGLTEHFPVLLNVYLCNNHKGKQSNIFHRKTDFLKLREFLEESWDDLLMSEDSDTCALIIVNKL